MDVSHVFNKEIQSCVDEVDFMIEFPNEGSIILYQGYGWTVTEVRYSGAVLMRYDKETKSLIEYFIPVGKHYRVLFKQSRD